MNEKQKNVSVFEPKTIKYIYIQSAKDYGQYLKIDTGEENFWHIVAEAFSIIDIGGETIIKIFPFYALPIQLKIENRKNIIYL